MVVSLSGRHGLLHEDLRDVPEGRAYDEGHQRAAQAGVLAAGEDQPREIDPLGQSGSIEMTSVTGQRAASI